MGKHFKTYVTILLCLICSVFQIKAVSNNDELIKKLEAQLIASEEANNIDSALEKAQQLINVLNQINDVQNWVNVVTTKAEMLRSIADLEKALETINQAEEKAEKHCKGPILARFYNRKASILFELKISTEALAYVLKSQAANLTYPDQGIEFSNLNLLGAIYRDAHDYNKATTVLQELNRKSFKSKDTSEYLLSCYNLALTFQKQNEFDSVLKYAFGYVHFTPELYNRQVGEHMYHCIAQAYEKLEKYDLAYQYLDTTHLYRLQTLEEMMQGRISEHRAKSQLTIQQLENERLIERNKSKQNQLYLML
ncbi:MAG: hypothetical protein KDC92_12555, partial [Bacteroidetes bacterium]|nr:hypothetical protein [Bacteroidota bacterium]